MQDTIPQLKMVLGGYIDDVAQSNDFDLYEDFHYQYGLISGLHLAGITDASILGSDGLEGLNMLYSQLADLHHDLSPAGNNA